MCLPQRRPSAKGDFVPNDLGFLGVFRVRFIAAKATLFTVSIQEGDSPVILIIFKELFDKKSQCRDCGRDGERSHGSGQNAKGRRQ